MHMNAQLPKTRMRRISGYASIWKEANGLYCLVASQQSTCLPTAESDTLASFPAQERSFPTPPRPFSVPAFLPDPPAASR
jgi:hypothetical protein